MTGPITIPNQVSICFSGGVDSLFITAMALQCYPEVKHFNLITTCFGDSEEEYNNGSDRKKAVEAIDFLIAR